MESSLEKDSSNVSTSDNYSHSDSTSESYDSDSELETIMCRVLNNNETIFYCLETGEEVGRLSPATRSDDSRSEDTYNACQRLERRRLARANRNETRQQRDSAQERSARGAMSNHVETSTSTTTQNNDNNNNASKRLRSKSKQVKTKNNVKQFEKPSRNLPLPFEKISNSWRPHFTPNLYSLLTSHSIDDNSTCARLLPKLKCIKNNTTYVESLVKSETSLMRANDDDNDDNVHDEKEEHVDIDDDHANNNTINNDNNNDNNNNNNNNRLQEVLSSSPSYRRSMDDCVSPKISIVDDLPPNQQLPSHSNNNNTNDTDKNAKQSEIILNQTTRLKNVNNANNKKKKKKKSADKPLSSVNNTEATSPIQRQSTNNIVEQEPAEQEPPARRRRLRVQQHLITDPIKEKARVQQRLDEHREAKQREADEIEAMRQRVSREVRAQSAASLKSGVSLNSSTASLGNSQKKRLRKSSDNSTRTVRRREADRLLDKALSTPPGTQSKDPFQVQPEDTLPTYVMDEKIRLEKLKKRAERERQDREAHSIAKAEFADQMLMNDLEKNQPKHLDWIGMQILGQMVMESNLLSVVEEQARKQQFNQNYTESQGADACYNHDTSQLQHNAARGSSMNHARRRQRAASLAPNHFAQQSHSATAQRAPRHAVSNAIFIANCARLRTRQIQELFGRFGRMEDMRPTRSGYVVRYRSMEAARDALQTMHSTVVDGICLNIDFEPVRNNNVENHHKSKSNRNLSSQSNQAQFSPINDDINQSNRNGSVNNTVNQLKNLVLKTSSSNNELANKQSNNNNNNNRSSDQQLQHDNDSNNHTTPNNEQQTKEKQSSPLDTDVVKANTTVQPTITPFDDNDDLLVDYGDADDDSTTMERSGNDNNVKNVSKNNSANSSSPSQSNHHKSNDNRSPTVRSQPHTSNSNNDNIEDKRTHSSQPHNNNSSAPSTSQTTHNDSQTLSRKPRSPIDKNRKNNKKRAKSMPPARLSGANSTPVATRVNQRVPLPPPPQPRRDHRLLPRKRPLSPKHTRESDATRRRAPPQPTSSTAARRDHTPSADRYRPPRYALARTVDRARVYARHDRDTASSRRRRSRSPAHPIAAPNAPSSSHTQHIALATTVPPARDALNGLHFVNLSEKNKK